MSMTDSERLARIEAMVEEMYSRVCPEKESRAGQDTYERAIRELARGNKKPLRAYMQRGGKIPKQARTESC